MDLRKLKQHFQVAEKLRETAWRNLRSKQVLVEAKKVADAKTAAKAKKKKVIPTATATDVIKISHADVSKLSVAFGFHLGDKDSKASAKAAATKWRVEGKKAANSIFIGKNTPSSKNTLSSKGRPGSPNSAGKNTTSRSAAILLSNESMGSKYPGWTKKTFERASGNTAGTKDAYFYSPHQQIKFRAMKGVDLFIGILSEPGVGGESVAMKLYKQRGYKQ